MSGGAKPRRKTPVRVVFHPHQSRPRQTDLSPEPEKTEIPYCFSCFAGFETDFGCPRPGRDHQRSKLITLFTNKPCPATAEAPSRRNLTTKSRSKKEDRLKPSISSTFPAGRRHFRPLCDVRLTAITSGHKSQPSPSTVYTRRRRKNSPKFQLYNYHQDIFQRSPRRSRSFRPPEHHHSPPPVVRR